MKKVIILRSLIEDKIHGHFDNNGKYDWWENKTTQFEVEFNFQNCQVIVPYDINKPGIYRKEWIAVFDKEKNDYNTEDENLIISNKNYNPNNPTIDQRIEEIKEHENRKADEDNFSYDWTNGLII